jgi:hypothetical protein
MVFGSILKRIKAYVFMMLCLRTKPGALKSFKMTLYDVFKKGFYYVGVNYGGKFWIWRGNGS